MDILRCYKILELDHEASMEEAREAYIDMARVWHPDRFTGNPRLRKKAEEKLKVINIAYAEIRSRLSTGPEILRTKKVVQRKQGASEAIFRNIFLVKEFARNLGSCAYSIFKKTDLKEISRQLFYPRIGLGRKTNRQRQNNERVSRRPGHTGKSRGRHRNFAEIYEEVARAKKEEKRKMREMR